MTVYDYLGGLRARGVSAFSTEKFRADLSLTKAATSLALWRLRRKLWIATPVNGYHLIVPPEYRALGCLPPEHFIDGLMTHLKQPYYVALLCAAEIHGAAHQRPQVFQVMVAKKRAGIKCGSVRVEFCVRQNTAEIPCSRHKVPTGYMRVSSPEATAFDLVGYLNRSAGLNNTATVLAELDESLRSGPLAEVAKLSPVAWAQRLGCLLELQDRKRHRKALAAYVMRHAGKVVGLAPWKSIKGSPRDARWKVALNETVEPDTI